MVHRVLQCLVCWKSWHINKILWTYKRKERKEETKTGGYLQRRKCKVCQVFLKQDQRERSCLSMNLLLLFLLCHLKHKSGPCSLLKHPFSPVPSHAQLRHRLPPDRKLFVVCCIIVPWVAFCATCRFGVSCNDFKVAATDANYTLHFQTQGQGDIQTTGTFYPGIFYHPFKGPARVMKGFFLEGAS